MTLVFSLIGGLLVAVAIQLVFANLGIALGLTILDWSPGNLPRKGSAMPDEANSLTEPDAEDSEESSGPSLPITHFLGFGVAVGFSSVIFIATLLSVEFGELMEPRRGMIFGLIFWATYWLLFIWLSSTTLAGIADSLLGTALEGGKQLVSTIKEAVDRKKDDRNQPANAKPTDADEPSAEQSMLKALIAEVSQLSDVQKELPTLLANQRETLLAEICDRTNLSTEAAETIVQELEVEKSPAVPAPAPTSTLMSQLDLPSWPQVLRRTLNKVDLSGWDIETIWEQIPLDTDDVQHATAQLVSSATAVLPDSISMEGMSSEDSQSEEADPEASQESASEELEPENLKLQKSNVISPDLSPEAKAIQSKIISYCRYTNTDLLTPENLTEKVRTQREDYGLTDESMIADMPLDVAAIAAVLSRRKKLNSARQQALLKALQLAWPASVDIATTNMEATDLAAADKTETDKTETDLSVRGIAEKAYKTLEAQLQSVDWSKASLEDIKPEVNLLLEQIEREGTLRSLDWRRLSSRIQLPETTRAEFTAWLHTAWMRKVEALRPAATKNAQTLSQQLADQITYFLHHQKKVDLEPEKIASGLTRMVSGAIAALPNPSELVDSVHIDNVLDSHAWDKKLWDKDAWQQALEKRKDLTAEEIQQILDWGQRVWQPKVQQVGGLLQVARAEISEHLSLPDVKASDILPDSNPIEEVRQQIVGQIATAQEKVVERAIAVRSEIQSQADAARRQVAIAAWWLFIALISSGSAAVGAGWLAALY